jgi:hypothetical protein
VACFRCGFREGVVGPVGVFDRVLEFGVRIVNRSEGILVVWVWDAADFWRMTFDGAFADDFEGGFGRGRERGDLL